MLRAEASNSLQFVWLKAHQAMRGSPLFTAAPHSRLAVLRTLWHLFAARKAIKHACIGDRTMRSTRVHRRSLPKAALLLLLLPSLAWAVPASVSLQHLPGLTSDAAEPAEHAELVTAATTAVRRRALAGARWGKPGFDARACEATRA